MYTRLPDSIDTFKHKLRQMLLPTQEQQEQITIAKEYIKGKRNPFILDSVQIDSLINDKTKKLYAQKARIKAQNQQKQHILAQQQMEEIYYSPISQKQAKRPGVPVVFYIKPPPIQPELRFQWRLK